METVDILMPVYNRQKFIREAIESILKQTYQNIRLVIYDDGSTDQSLKIAQSYIPYGVEVYWGKHQGLGATRNLMREFIRSPYVAFMDSDDISHPERIATEMIHLFLSQADIIFSALTYWKHPSNYRESRHVHRLKIEKYTSREGLWDNMTFATALFKADLKKYPFNDACDMGHEDVEWLENLIKEGVKISYVDESLYWVRRHDQRTTEIRKRKGMFMGGAK